MVAPPTDGPRARAARLVVLVSGGGTLLQALLDAEAEAAGRARPAPFTVAAVGSDRPHAPGLARAARAGVPSFVVPLAGHESRAAWDEALAGAVGAHRPDLLVLAGFMRLLGEPVLRRFGGRTLNCHPSLLPAFPGAHAVADALAAGVPVTGASVILVDAGVDTGPVLAQREVPVLPGDDEASLHERIKAVERSLLVEVVTAVARSGPPPHHRRVVTA